MITTILQSYRKQQEFHKPTGAKPLIGRRRKRKERGRGLVLKSILSLIWITQNIRNKSGLGSLSNKWAETMKGPERMEKKIEKQKNVTEAM